MGANKAVICVFDGLRPDRVTEALTPNLWQFATGGTWFRECRSVFPSVTRVAGASFATGSKPATHGVVNNAFFHPAVIGDRPLDTGSAEHLRAAEAHHDGSFIEAEGLGCALARAGKSYAVVHSGSAGSAYMVSHKARANGHWTFSIHGREKTQTPEAADEVTARFGQPPQDKTPKQGQMDYSATVFLEHILGARRPDVALIWFSEPDDSYHYREIGSTDSIAITRRVDAHFGAILDAVSQGPDADETLVVAMSDHGQIAMVSTFDLFGALTAAGFPTSNRAGDGVEVLATHGAMCGLTLVEKDPARLDALAETLMGYPETGMLFSRTRSPEEGEVAGTFPYALVGVDHPRAPDLVWVARSSADADQHGLLGTGLYTGGNGVAAGGGMHGGLNPYELNNMLAFGGSGVPLLGAISDPADLTDIVPTILTALGCPIPAGMNDRPLAAITGGDRPDDERETVTMGRDGFEQSITLARGGPRPIVLSGGRRNSE